MKAELKSSIDVCLWFSDKARDGNEYLQPLKMHFMLYLAQAYYGVLYHRMLMPCLFVADELGPIEPQTYRCFENGIPHTLIKAPIPQKETELLEGIWKKFGKLSTNALAETLKNQPPYYKAFDKAVRSNIELDDMIEFYSNIKTNNARNASADNIIKPRVLRTQHGRTVAVKAWVPGAKK